jgi:DNA polymerase elongation subunit (family B)
MYQAVYFHRHTNVVHLWDDEKGYMRIPYKRYAYVKAPNGNLTALDGTLVKKVSKFSGEDPKDVYESDVRPDVRTLIDMYYHTDDVSKDHRILFFDIEVQRDEARRHSTIEDATNVINSVAYYNNVDREYNIFVIDPTVEKVIKEQRDSGNIFKCPTEADLLMLFLKAWNKFKPTIAVGWNCDKFDIPYLVNRMKRVLGEEYVTKLSPIGIVDKDRKYEQYQIAGVTVFDLMRLYRQYTYNEEPSYSLDYISRKELNRGKVEYEGSLDTLYATDVDKFIEYNRVDVELMVELDDKLKFIDLARSICHKGHVPYSDVYAATRTLDGACLTFLKRAGIVAPNRQVSDDVDDTIVDDEDDDSFTGAFVKDPVPGRYEWVFDEDASGLYPNTQRTLNMSPETKMFRIDNWDMDAFITNKPIVFKVSSKRLSWTPNELREYLVSNNYSIAANGVVYDLNRKGLIPSILEQWSQERDEFRALAKQNKQEGNKELYEYYESRQLTQKIISNSLYGVLGNRGFRFYDLDNAEATTITGQAVVKHAMMKGNEWFTKATGVDRDYVIYVDTDSNFFSAMPIIEMLEKKQGRSLSYDEKAAVTFKTSQQVEKFINGSFDAFAKLYCNVETHFWTFKQEYVAEAAIWIAKKRYAQKIISEKGVSIAEMTKGAKQFKLDVKGLDVVRSNFPKKFREYMSDLLIRLLDNESKTQVDEVVLDFKEYLLTVENVTEIMPASSIKKFGEYTSQRSDGFLQTAKGTPIHIKSAINYNNLLHILDIPSAPRIDVGQKVKWAYIKPNQYTFDTIAIPDEGVPEPVMDFLKQHLNNNLIYEKIMTKKLQSYYDAMGWGDIPNNKNVGKFFSFS